MIQSKNIVKAIKTTDYIDKKYITNRIISNKKKVIIKNFNI